jgi:methionine-rich copper-binding protein CopC
MRALLLALAVVLGTAGAAHGHARLVRSEPTNGAVVESTQRIVLEFNTPVEQRFATFVLELGDGSTRTLTAGGEGVTTKIELAVGAVPQGKHRLRWSVVSQDGHRIKGTLAFAVGAAR